MERRTIQLSGCETRLETRDDDSPQIVGYAAVFPDGTPETEFSLWPGLTERIMPGAFDSALNGRDKGGPDDVRALFNHNTDLILGRRSAKTLELSVDKRGLLYRIDPADTVAARDVLVSVERGDITGSSLAFQVLKQTFIENEDGTEIREIQDVRLFDVGPVTFPAYDGTTAGLRADDGADEAKAAYLAWRVGREDARKRLIRRLDRDLDLIRARR